MNQNNEIVEMTEITTEPESIIQVRPEIQKEPKTMTKKLFREEGIRLLNQTVQIYSDMFYRAYYHYAWVNILLFFIPTVLSSISGSLVFSDLSNEFTDIKWILGTLSLIGGIFPNIEKAFKVNDNKQNCLKRYRRFQKMSLELDEQTMLDDDSRRQHKTIITEIFKKLDKELDETEDMPIIPSHILKKYQKMLSSLAEQRQNLQKDYIIVD